MNVRHHPLPPVPTHKALPVSPLDSLFRGEGEAYGRKRSRFYLKFFIISLLRVAVKRRARLEVVPERQ